MKKRKQTYSSNCLLRDVRKNNPAHRLAAADLLSSICAHLRVACWQYERVELAELGHIEVHLSKGPNPQPIMSFHPDEKLMADIRAVWGGIE